MMTKALLLVALFAASAAAQDSASDSSSLLARRGSYGISFTQSRPQGDLARNIGIGYGVNGTALLKLDDAGVLSLRADIGILSYGTERKEVAFSETVGDRVRVGVRTTNFTVPMSVGPQLTWPTGIVRPYVNAGIGGQAFFTESQVEGITTALPIASTTNHSDFAFAWTSGIGMYVPMRVARTSVMLDLGMQYLNGRSASYLSRGSIVDQPGGAVSITPMESSTHQVMVRIGAKIGG